MNGLQAPIDDLPGGMLAHEGGLGLVAQSGLVPEGWQTGGVIIPAYGCGEPVVRDKCVAGEDVAHRPGVAGFPAIPIEQGFECSTLSPSDHEAHARARLLATVEWALGRQLQSDVIGAGPPSLDDAPVMGVTDDPATLVGCLEQAAVGQGFGSRWMLHTTIRGASHLRAFIKDGRSITGARWVISPGYENPNDTSIRVWVTGPVWAGYDTPIQTWGAVERRQNTATGWASTIGVVAFDPCILAAADLTVPACPTP